MMQPVRAPTAWRFANIPGVWSKAAGRSNILQTSTGGFDCQTLVCAWAVNGNPIVSLPVYGESIGTPVECTTPPMPTPPMPIAMKPTNPKDAVGVDKVGMSVIPAGVLMEVALGMQEGALKYGRHNYRAVGVRASVYYDATMRHLTDWWEGTDIDPDSGLSHVTKAIASLMVLRDCMLRENVEDDRPPRMPKGWLTALNTKAAALRVKYKSHPKPKHCFEKEPT